MAFITPDDRSNGQYTTLFPPGEQANFPSGQRIKAPPERIKRRETGEMSQKGRNVYKSLLSKAGEALYNTNIIMPLKGEVCSPVQRTEPLRRYPK